MSTKHYKTPVNSVALPQHLRIQETGSCHTPSRCQHHALGLHDFSNYELNKSLFFYQLPSLGCFITATENRVMSVTRDSLTSLPFVSFLSGPMLPWSYPSSQRASLRDSQQTLQWCCVWQRLLITLKSSFLFLSNSDHVSQVFVKETKAHGLKRRWRTCFSLRSLSPLRQEGTLP